MYACREFEQYLSYKSDDSEDGATTDVKGEPPIGNKEGDQLLMFVTCVFYFRF